MYCYYATRGSIELLLVSKELKLSGKNMGKTVARKVFASVPDQLASELQDWADKQGRSVSSLIAYLLERGMAQSKEKGEYVPAGTTGGTKAIAMIDNEQPEKLPDTTVYPVAKPKLCNEISEKYGWPLLAKRHTGRPPLPWECVFDGDRKFPKQLNDPELYEKE